RPRTSRRDSRFRFEILNKFVDEGMQTRTPHETAVWLVLFRDTKPNGIARSSVNDIARRAGIGRRTLIRALKRLAAGGMLRVVQRGSLNRGASSYHVFLFPVPVEWG